jgi:hypothetical protein
LCVISRVAFELVRDPVCACEQAARARGEPTALERSTYSIRPKVSAVKGLGDTGAAGCIIPCPLLVTCRDLLVDMGQAVRSPDEQQGAGGDLWRRYATLRAFSGLRGCGPGLPIKRMLRWARSKGWLPRASTRQRPRA